MKIENSTVAMNSERRFNSYTSVESMTLETRDGAGMIENIGRIAQEEGKDAVSAMRQYEKDEKAAQEKQQKQNQARALMEYMDRTRQCRDNFEQFRMSDETELQIKLLRKLLAALNGKGRLDPLDKEMLKSRDVLDLRSSNMKKAEMIAGIRGGHGPAEGGPKGAVEAPVQPGTTPFGTVWHRVSAVSGIHAESELTTFQSTGLVKTADGREISFNVDLSMSRSFMEKIDIFTDETYIKTDPLMINLDTDIGTVSDVKFTFDLDSDGRTEEISFAGEGSGFLAVDRNGNGIIDDGSELFGTASGDGFADLAAYDEDGNFWIDENDSIYSQLRVWTKDSEGNDKLIDLKSADVGAIYLGNVSTEFSLKNDANETNGVIQKTGVYLKESGGVGTMNHVDLVL